MRAATAPGSRLTPGNGAHARTPERLGRREIGPTGRGSAAQSLAGVDILPAQSVIQTTHAARERQSARAPQVLPFARSRARKDPAEAFASGAGSAEDEAT